MFQKRLLVVISFILALVLQPMAVFASDFVFRLANVHGQYLDVFIERGRPYEDLSVTVSGQDIRIDDSGLLAVSGHKIFTTVLVNVSSSMPQEVLNNLRDLLLLVVAERDTTEQIRLMGVGESTVLLQDFTDHHMQLNDAINQMLEAGFESEVSSIADAIYRIIPNEFDIGGSLAFHRAVIITDELHDELGLISGHRLYERLRGGYFPLYIVEVTPRVEPTGNDSLLALSRVSGTRWTNLNPWLINVGDIMPNIHVRNLYWLRAVVPDSLLDDSTTDVVITIDGTALRFSVFFPEYEAPGGLEITQTPVIDAAAGLLPDVIIDNTIFIIASVLVISVFIFVMLKFRSRLKMPKIPKPKVPKIEVPKLKKEAKPPREDHSDATLLKSSTLDYNAINIRLKNIANGRPLGYFCLKDGLTIGRSKKCDVKLSDKSVCDEHCLIIEKDRHAVIENKSQKRITKLNNELITQPRNLIVGDKIVCGTVSLLVEEIVLPKPPLEELSKLTHFANV